MGRYRAAAVVLFVLLGCESNEEKMARTRAEAEARVYAEAAARSSDFGARQFESAEATTLLNAREAHATALREFDWIEREFAGKTSKPELAERSRRLEVAKQTLTRTEEKLETQRKVVEANRVKLIRLKEETEKAIADPQAELSQDILRDRLEGIEESLAESNAALAARPTSE